MRELVTFFRHNPQALLLLVICAVLGIGAFVAIVIALATAGSGTTNGEPSGMIVLLGALAA